MSRRLEILRRATEIFERQGVSRTSIEDIANAVGVKREAIYYYFKSRNDILAEIILPSSTALLVGLRNILRSDQPSREKLKAAIESHLNAFSPSYLEMTVALREVHFSGGDEKLNELKKVWTEYGELWTALIREGQADGSFKAGVNPKMASFGVLGMCNWLSRWYQPGKGMTIADITDTFFTMLADGLAQIPAPTPPSA